jgi:hypothetical protein
MLKPLPAGYDRGLELKVSMEMAEEYRYCFSLRRLILAVVFFAGAAPPSGSRECRSADAQTGLPSTLPHGAL